MIALGLTQHISQPTHNKGNILDLVFTELDSKITITGCRANTPLSDHYSVIIDTNIMENKTNIVTKTIRDTTKLSPTHLMEAYTPPIFKPEDTIDQGYNQFKEELLKILDAVAPQKVIKTTEKLHQACIYKHIRQQHKVLNNHYHFKVKYKQTHQWTAYKKERNIYN